MSVSPAEWSGCMWVSSTVSICGGIDAGGAHVVEQLAGGGQQVVAGSGLDQREAAGRVDQEGVDLCAAGRPEIVGQDLAGLVLRDVAQHVEASRRGSRR